MRYLVFTNTPAHVHVYKHVVKELEERGHDVLVLGRDYGCTRELLDWYDLPYRIFGTCSTSKYSLFARLPGHYTRMIRDARRFDPDLVIGYGAYAAHTGVATGAQTALVMDSEPERLDIGVSRPFVDVILTPNTFRKHLGRKHYVYDGFKECAYLHPEIFSPRSNIRDLLGLESEPYVMVRFNAFGSHHDVGRGGLTAEQRYSLIERLSESAVVFVSDEGGEMDLEGLSARRYDLHPARLHDVLAEAELLVADTQTMVTEAALLATPAIRSNSFVGNGDMGNFLELERHELVYNLADFDDVLHRADELLNAADVTATWQERRDAYLARKVNLSSLLVEFALSRSVEQIDGIEPRSPPLRV